MGNHVHWHGIPAVIENSLIVRFHGVQPNLWAVAIRRGDFYGSSIALAIHSFDRSLFSRLIAFEEISIAFAIRSVDPRSYGFSLCFWHIDTA